MENSIAKVLTHVYELEGLLLVVDRHGADTPAVVIDRIREKATQLAADAQLIAVPGKPEPDVAPALTQPAPQPAPTEEKKEAPTTDLPADDYDADDTWQHDNGEDASHAFTLDYVEPQRQEQLGADEPITDDEVDDDAPADERPATASESLRVDEKLQRSMSKDMRRAFSINFRRELFSNSDVEMNDALNLIESMQSIDEAEDYFYGDLGWDRDNAEVEDFMNIVRNHFL